MDHNSLGDGLAHLGGAHLMEPTGAVPAGGGERRTAPGRTGSRGARSRTWAGAADERSGSEGRWRSIREEPLGGRRLEPGSPVSVIISARHHRHRRIGLT